MNLRLLSEEYSVCHLSPLEALPDWSLGPGFHSITRTDSELSILCRRDYVPGGIQQEAGWRGIEVEGPLDFDQIGILVGMLKPLEEAAIPVFVLSTFLTDYIFIQSGDLTRAAEALQTAGHTLLTSGRD
jgi:hypothetical protein